MQVEEWRSEAGQGEAGRGEGGRGTKGGAGRDVGKRSGAWWCLAGRGWVGQGGAMGSEEGANKVRQGVAGRGKLRQGVSGKAGRGGAKGGGAGQGD